MAMANIDWREALLNERQRKEVEFCQAYEANYNHGTDGHNAKLIIALLAETLDFIFQEMKVDIEPVLDKKSLRSRQLDADS